MIVATRRARDRFSPVDLVPPEEERRSLCLTTLRAAHSSGVLPPSSAVSACTSERASRSSITVVCPFSDACESGVFPFLSSGMGPIPGKYVIAAGWNCWSGVTFSSRPSGVTTAEIAISSKLKGLIQVRSRTNHSTLSLAAESALRITGHRELNKFS